MTFKTKPLHPDAYTRTGSFAEDVQKPKQADTLDAARERYEYRLNSENYTNTFARNRYARDLVNLVGIVKAEAILQERK